MFHFLRVLCLLLTLGAVATAWVWTERGEWVKAFDWHLVNWYERGYEDEIREIQKSLVNETEDRDSHLNRLEEIRQNCRHSVFGDRLFLPWRQAVELLSEGYMEDNRYKDAIRVLKVVPKKDPTHIPLLLRLASAYCMEGSAKSLEKASEITEVWSAKLPTHPGMRSVQLLVAALGGRVDELANVIDTYLYPSMSYLAEGWQLFLFGADGSGIEQSPQVRLVGPDGSGMYELAHTFPNVPEALLQVRLDGPPLARLQISDVSVELTQDGQSIGDSSGWGWDGFVAIEKRPGGVYVFKSNKDPRMRMRFPEKIEGLKGPVSARVRFRLDPILSNELRTILTDPGLRSQLSQKLDDSGWNGSLDVVCPPPIGLGGSQ